MEDIDYIVRFFSLFAISLPLLLLPLRKIYYVFLEKLFKKSEKQEQTKLRFEVTDGTKYNIDVESEESIRAFLQAYEDVRRRE